ncbi:MAG TPA: hypothetical protein PLR18_01955 [bacterium]|nr:hypothetical protein [bacterium]
MTDIDEIKKWTNAEFTKKKIQKITSKKAFVFSAIVDINFDINTDPKHFVDMTADEVAILISDELAKKENP